MANNRMYLVHKVTGKKLYLGKRMGHGYYNPPSMRVMEAFFNECADDDVLADPFVIEYECEPEYDRKF
jgi:hypothetical protein